MAVLARFAHSDRCALLDIRAYLLASTYTRPLRSMAWARTVSLGSIYALILAQAQLLHKQTAPLFSRATSSISPVRGRRWRDTRMRQPQLVAFQVHVIADNLSELCLGMYHTSRHPSFLDRADGLAS